MVSALKIKESLIHWRYGIAKQFRSRRKTKPPCNPSTCKCQKKKKKGPPIQKKKNHIDTSLTLMKDKNYDDDKDKFCFDVH